MIALLYKIFYRLAWLLTWSLQSFFPKVQKGFELRKTQNGVKPWLAFTKHSRPIWIHAPSGEFEYALPVIREIKARSPQTQIMVTYYTPSYIARISKEPLVDFFCPLPWDTSHDLSEFLEHHQPQRLLIARTGAWPEMLRQCERYQIPVILFSMTFNKNVSALSRVFHRWLYKTIDRFLVVSNDDKNNLLKVDKDFVVDALGDTRYDQCLYRLAQNHPVKIARDILPKKVFVCASTWPEDEAVILPYIQKHSGDAHWIVVPHEITSAHIKSLQEQLRPLPTTLYSQIQTWNGDGVLIVDEFGVLASLYKLSDGAFIGGSFKARVHSVMEALACGNITFVGPHHTNNREALEFLSFAKTSRAPVQILRADAVDISSELEKWSALDRDILKEAVRLKAGVSTQVVERIGVSKP